MSAFQPGIEIRPVAGCIGAEVLSVDLTAEISQVQFELIHQAFLEYLVIFLPQAKVLTPAHLTAFARHFGELDDDPFVFPFKIPAIEGYPEIYSNIKTAENTGINIGGYWHADVTYRKKPHRAHLSLSLDTKRGGGVGQLRYASLCHQRLLAYCFI